MTRWIIGLGLALLLVLVLAAPALATHGEPPKGSCPEGFELHDMSVPHEHGDHPHKHVGNDKDQNQDGYLCVKHVGQNGAIHIHVDNDLPLE
jgi:hypothetical protein